MSNIGFHESLEREFKRDKDKPISDEDLIDVVVSLANTHGGELYIGVDDDGEISGLHPKHSETDGLTALIANKTMPALSVKIEKVNGTNPYLIIHVPKYQWGYMATKTGKYLKRRIKADGTPETVAVSPNDFVPRMSNLSLIDFSAQPLPELSYEDLDEKERIRLREIIKLYAESSDKTLLELSDEELDKALHLITIYEGRYVPTVTGLLLIGKEKQIQKYFPTAKTAFQVIQGTNIKVNEEFTKPILKTIEIVSQYIKMWNPETEIYDGMFRISIPMFNTIAIREGLINAFSHRDYTILNRIRILINDDGLTISSPGGFVEGVTMNNLLNVDPHARNPCLADALKRIGLAEKTGRGIDKIYEGTIMYGKPWPDYSESDSTIVKLFIQRAEPDEAFTSMILGEKKKQGQNLPLNSLLILSALKDEKWINSRKISELIKLPPIKTKAALKQLEENGLVDSYETDKGKIYLLNSKVYKQTKDIIKYVNKHPEKKLEKKTLLHQFVITNGKATRKDVTNLLHISESQASRLLKKQVDEGYLKLVGTRKSATYYPTEKITKK